MFNSKDYSKYSFLKHDFMERLYAISLGLIFVLLNVNEIYAQTNQPDLNQMELLKQFARSGEQNRNS